jgi:hypothetical protein
MHDRVLAPIRAHLAEWDIAHVESAIYGTEDVERIARAIEDFCRREVASAPDETLFYQSSIGAVIGLRLLDGRKVVIKAHQPDWERRRLEEVARLQSMIAAAAGLAPDEARAFVAEYEAAVGRPFTIAERELCGAAFAYSVAYTSRCGHASGVDTRDQPGTFQHLIATLGTKLLEL